MHKRVLSIILATSIVFTVGSSALAAPTQGQLDQSKTNLTQSQQKVQDLDTQMQKVDHDIETILREKAGIDSKIDKAQASINIVNKSIKESQNKINNEQEVYGQRIRTMYMNGKNQSYINIVLGSKSFSDLISNIETVQKISDYDKNLMDNLNSEKSRIEKQKDKLASEKASLVALQSQDQKKLQDANSKKSQVLALENKAKAEMQKNKAYYDQLQAQSNQEKTRLLSMNTSASTSSSSPSHDRGQHVVPAGSYSGVVGIAAQFVNRTPYVWGGTTPSGFDCSGLVMYCYAQVGVSLPHYTGEQVKYGSTVSANNLQPGDLLFFGSVSDPYHVAIYAGGGQMIEAPRAGEDVHITPVRPFSIAKRI